LIVISRNVQLTPSGEKGAYGSRSWTVPVKFLFLAMLVAGVVVIFVVQILAYALRELS